MKTARDLIRLCNESKTFLDKYTYRGADCVLKSTRFDANKQNPHGFSSYIASCPDLGISSKGYDTSREAKADLHKQIDQSIEDRDSDESLDFSKHITRDGGKKILTPKSPLLADISVSKLMDMTSIEIKKLWSGLPSDVLYNLSDLFDDDQLQALSKHPDKRLAKDALDALAPWG